jgi:hypothetical protein
MHRCLARKGGGEMALLVQWSAQILHANEYPHERMIEDTHATNIEPTLCKASERNCLHLAKACTAVHVAFIQHFQNNIEHLKAYEIVLLPKSWTFCRTICHFLSSPTLDRDWLPSAVYENYHHTITAPSSANHKYMYYTA